MMNNNKMQHGETYTVKRMRLLSYLTQRGFYPNWTLPDKDNPRYNVWKYVNTPELEAAIEDYFAELNNK